MQRDKPIERKCDMPNDYELRNTGITGTASDLYREYELGWISQFDLWRLYDILATNGMDEEADEVKKELLDIIMYEGGEEEASES